MKCDACLKSDKDVNLRHIPCEIKIDGKEIQYYLCDNCFKSEKYFVQNKSLEIRMYPKKGYNFDYKKEGDKKRSFFKSKNKIDEYTIITYFEALEIEDEDEEEGYENQLYKKVEIYLNSKLTEKVIPKNEECMCDIGTSVGNDYFVPTEEFFDLKKQQLEEKMELLEEIKKLYY